MSTLERIEKLVDDFEKATVEYASFKSIHRSTETMDEVRSKLITAIKAYKAAPEEVPNVRANIASLRSGDEVIFENEKFYFIGQGVLKGDTSVIQNDTRLISVKDERLYVAGKPRRKLYVNFYPNGQAYWSNVKSCSAKECFAQSVEVLLPSGVEPVRN